MRMLRSKSVLQRTTFRGRFEISPIFSIPVLIDFRNFSHAIGLEFHENTCSSLSFLEKNICRGNELLLLKTLQPSP